MYSLRHDRRRPLLRRPLSSHFVHIAVPGETIDETGVVQVAVVAVAQPGPFVLTSFEGVKDTAQLPDLTTHRMTVLGAFITTYRGRQKWSGKAYVG